MSKTQWTLVSFYTEIISAGVLITIFSVFPIAASFGTKNRVSTVPMCEIHFLDWSDCFLAFFEILALIIILIENFISVETPFFGAWELTQLEPFWMLWTPAIWLFNVGYGTCLNIGFEIFDDLVWCIKLEIEAFYLLFLLLAGFVEKYGTA